MPKMPNYKWAERQLRPCPFCGEDKIQILPQAKAEYGRWWLIRCLFCPANMKVLTKYQRQLIAEWNYRFTDK